MKADVTRELRKIAEENGVKIHGRLRLSGKREPTSLLVFEDDMGHRFIWNQEDKKLTILIFCE